MKENREWVQINEDQQRNLVACSIQEDPRAHYAFAALRMRGALDLARLTHAVHIVSSRHDAMRAVGNDGQQPTQLTVADEVSVPPLEVEHVGGDIGEWLERTAGGRLELTRPWGRVCLGRTDDDDSGLLVVLPRAACDAFALQRLLKETVYAYEFAEREESSAVGFPDAVARNGLRAYMAAVAEDTSFGQHLQQAKARLGGELPPLQLPGDDKRPPVFSGRGRIVRHRLVPELRRDLEATAKALDITLLDLLLAGYLAVLQRWCGQEEVALGLYGPSRPWDGVAPVEGVGVLRAHIDPHAPLFDTARRLANAAREVRESLTVPFQALVQTLAPAHDGARTALFQAAVAPMPGFVAPRTVDGVTFSQHVFANVGARTDLTLCVGAEDTELELGLEYALDVIPEEMAQQMLNGLVRGLGVFPESEQLPVGRLPLLSDEERQRAFCPLVPRAYDAERPAYLRFEEHVDRQPNAVAVLMNGLACTYRELDLRANRLARCLRSASVGPETLVGIYCDRSVDMLVALLATHKAGGAYVPLDPSHPSSRVQVIVEDAAPRVLITQQALLTKCPTPEGCLTIAIDDPALLDESDQRLALDVDPDGLAYVIFTSGSTGRPKGVEIPHRAFTNFMSSMAHTPGMSADDRILSVTTLSFDIAGLELLLPLYVGGSVEICDRSTCIDAQLLIQRLADPAVSLMQATPATWRMLIDAGWEGNSRLKILCGGEPFPPDLVAALVERTAEVWNVYGPTETTVWSTVQRLTNTTTPIPIGGPIDNTSIYLLNPCGEPVPQGCVGEIWIGGHGVARGYRGRPELTSERFCPDPFVGDGVARMYKTGDLGRLRSDGTLICLGRVDFQVKIRGFRIELGDIEAQILKHPDVREAVVVAREEQSGHKRLIAYVVAASGAAELSTTLRAALKQTLPSYMIPSGFVRVDTMPLNPSGKIDRKALPAPEELAEAPDVDAPGELADDLEAAIEAVFLDVLNARSINPETSFFDAGGDSLLAVRLVRNLTTAVGMTVPLALLFETASVRGLAQALRAKPMDADRPRVVLLRRGTSDAKLFCVYGVALYQHLAHSVPAHISVYGVFVPIETQIFAEERLARGELDFPSVKELAHMYLKIIREVQPEGPYRILGISFGGVVAYEIGCQLRAEGEQVALLGLLDALLPQSMNGSHLVGRLKGEVKEWLRRARDLALKPHVRSAITRLVRGRFGRTPDGAWSEAELEWLRDQIHDLQVARYAARLKPYDGSAVIVHADDRQAYQGLTVNAAAGWRDAIQGEVVEIRVPGDHLGIVAPPNVTQLAAKLKPYL